MSSDSEDKKKKQHESSGSEASEDEGDERKSGRSEENEDSKDSHSESHESSEEASDKSGSGKGSKTSRSGSETGRKSPSKRRNKGKRKRSGSGSKDSSKSDKSGSDSESKEDKDKDLKHSDDESAKRSEAEDVSPERRTGGAEAFSNFVLDDDSRSMSLAGLMAKLEEIKKYMSQQRAGESMQGGESDSLWKDEDFPPINKSLAKNEEKLKEIKALYKNNVKWMRPNTDGKEVRFAVNEFARCDLKFGYASDAVFTSALGLLAIHNSVENLFVDVDHVFDEGYAVFQFFKNGEWRYVIVDTYLPYSPEKKSYLYSECGESNEVWVQLTEKAYAKLNGSYQNIQGMDICEVLVDLTGGVSEKEDIDAEKYKEAKDAKDNPETAALYSKIVNFLKNRYLLGCIKHVPGKNASSKENGDRGIYENLYYGMMGLWEFSQGSEEPRRLMKIRNYWGVEGNWNGDWCNNHEDWDRNPEIRKTLLPDQKSKSKDDYIQFFMKLTDWAREFNSWYICKVFSDTWQKYSIAGEWMGKTAGGPYPDLEDMFCARSKLRKFSQLDTDDKWFNNPQYRIKVSKRTTVIISLMQEDKRYVDAKNKFVSTNFIVVRCAGRNTRIWEMPEERQILCDASKTKEGKAIRDRGEKTGEFPREITCKLDLHPFEGKNYGYYIIIPYTTEEATSKKAASRRLFWLRVFTSEQTSIEQVKETLMIEQKGEWTDKKPCGPMYTINAESDDPKDLRGVYNPFWCQNPQYFLNITEPTHLKIILRKDKEPMRRKDKVRIGLSICKHFEKRVIEAEARKPVVSKSKLITDPTDKLLKQTKEHLEPPKMTEIERKLQIGPHEDYYESSFSNQDIAALYFHFLPIHGPLVIVPCQSERSKNNTFTLRIYSDKKIAMSKLDDDKNVCLVGSWVGETAGGCQLYNEQFYKEPDLQSWTKNPKYTLTFDKPLVANVKVTLAIATKNWRGKVSNSIKEQKKKEAEMRKKAAQDGDTNSRLLKHRDEDDDNANLSVATMISLYILKKKPAVTTEDVIKSAAFVPNLKTELTHQFRDMDREGLEYTIMPSTYYKGIEGDFLLSVNSDQKFTLK